jgi:dihydrodipicolinate synthase/N-acetylneuraminate lyase
LIDSHNSHAPLPAPLRGIVPPIVTPLTEDAQFDVPSFVGLTERLTQAGVHGIFLLGTTGEFASLTTDTRRQIVFEGCRAAAPRVPVIVNVSDTSLEMSLQLTAAAAQAGAAAVAICPPYYFSLTQEDLFRYARRFAQASDLPVFLYNIPQNAHSEFEVSTVRRLAELPNIVGLKNSNANLEYVSSIANIKSQRPAFSLLVGNEELMLSAMSVGADGSVCGGANIFPSLFVSLFHAIQSGSQAQAKSLQDLVVKIANQLYTVGSAKTSYLRGMKAALAALGVCGDMLAEPLHVFDPDEREELGSRLNRLLPEIP